ncbi:ABC transporter permease [Occultella kanbiaonis]|uniref:ABC transporter permease n=1 Tax=Occultella kanbiaonis TaxID=2675754 RepID=UPI0012B824FD|nr:ABC transporter permease [Occultella kanbiaonis]
MAAVDAAAFTEVKGLRRQLRRTGVSVNSALLYASLAWMAVVVLAALIPGVLATEDPTVLDPARALQPPGAGTPLGTEQYGRSVATLLVHGARSAMIIGLCATAFGMLVGSVLGLIAGYLGGWVDMVIGRFIDMLMCFPGVLLALIIAAALGSTTTNLILAVGIATVPGFARVMRGQVLTVRGHLYVEAARSNGFSPTRTVFRHILPNALAPSVVMATVSIGVAIVVAASLSFLGLGPRTEVPDWGQLLSLGQPYLANSWWISTFPGITLTLTVIAVSLLGDWLRDRLDVE